MLFKSTQLLGLSAMILTFSSHTVLASIELRKIVRAMDEYQFLPLCQQTCIAGDASSVYNNVGDWTSVIGATNCDTKECFCVATNQPGIAERVKACLTKTTKCATPAELNGAMTFLGNWCGFPTFEASTTPPPGVPTTALPGYAATTGGATGSCWDSFGYPITTAGCATTMRPSRTATGSFGSTDTATPTSTSSSSSSGGTSIGTIAGLAVLGLFLAGIFGAGVWRFYFRLLCCGC